MQTKIITLGPTLVEIVGPSGAGKSEWAKDNFLAEEIVSTDALRQEITGDFRRQDMDDVVLNEFDKRIKFRLELGMRVVADATHIRNTHRRRTAKLAAETGARVIYAVINRSIAAKMNSGGWRNDVYVDQKPLIIRHDETFVANEATILSGDGGLARTVIDLRVEKPQIVHLLKRTDDATSEQQSILDIVSRGFTGILVVGDVHGNSIELLKLLRYARENNLFVIFLGDIVDYATDTLKCVDIVANAVFRGKAMSILGNHEKKIYKFITAERLEGVYANLEGFIGHLSHGNLVTVNQIKAMGATSETDRFKFETKFLSLCHTMPHILHLPGYYFTHGAMEKHMYDETPFRYLSESSQESYAMYGQTTGKYINGFPERLYNWVEEIPPRTTVVVGHECRQSSAPFVQQGEAGGRAIFLDTGSSKQDRWEDGHLSGLVLKIESRRKVGHVLENEKFIDARELP